MCLRKYLAPLALSLSMLPSPGADAARIKELTSIRGARANALVGYGLVVGLRGTGDRRRTAFTDQSVSSLLTRMGLNISASRLEVINTAAVMVTSELPAFATVGDRIDIVVSALGSARSLESGTLIMTPLKGANGKVYALAQGPITVGGFSVGTVPLASVRRNNTTAGRIPSGAIVERTAPSTYLDVDQIVFSLKEADFATADRIATAINETMSSTVTAVALDPGTVIVNLPEEALFEPVRFLATVEAIEVQPDAQARVVINERTGTVVVGGNVTLGPAAVAHANLNVTIQTKFGVSQPGAFSGGNTVVLPSVSLDIEEDEAELTAIPETATVDELVKALNALGASPRDLMAILQALKSTGALRAELKVL